MNLPQNSYTEERWFFKANLEPLPQYMGLSPNNTLVFQYCLGPFSLPSQTKDRILFARRLFLVVSDLDIDIYRKKRGVQKEKEGLFPKKRVPANQFYLFKKNLNIKNLLVGWAVPFPSFWYWNSFFTPTPHWTFIYFLYFFSKGTVVVLCEGVVLLKWKLGLERDF